MLHEVQPLSSVKLSFGFQIILVFTQVLFCEDNGNLSE
jgi:hypothetical protein